MYVCYFLKVEFSKVISDCFFFFVGFFFVELSGYYLVMLFNFGNDLFVFLMLFVNFFKFDVKYWFKLIVNDGSEEGVVFLIVEVRKGFIVCLFVGLFVLLSFV